MTVLHLRIKENNEVIDLDQGLLAQNMRLRRCVVIKNPKTGGAPHDYQGGIAINLEFLKGGLSIASNVNNDEISVPIDDSLEVNDVRFDLNFNAERVNRSFVTSIRNYDDTGTQPPFNRTAGANNNELKYVDLYFEYDKLYDYDTY